MYLTIRIRQAEYELLNIVREQLEGTTCRDSIHKSQPLGATDYLRLAKTWLYLFLLGLCTCRVSDG